MSVDKFGRNKKTSTPEQGISLSYLEKHFQRKTDITRKLADLENDVNKLELEAQGPCTGHRSIIAILYCFSFKYMKREKGRDLTQYTNLCGLNTLPH